MGVNWVELMAGVIILAGLIIGIKRGALRIAVTIAATILTCMLTSFVTPIVTKAVEDYTMVDEAIGSFATRAFYDEETEEELTIQKKDQETVIKEAGYPGIYTDLMLDNNNKAGYAKLGAETFVQYISGSIARFVISIVSFVLLLFVIGIVLRAVIFALDIISKIPVLGTVNRIAGGAMGVMVSLFILWVFFALVVLIQRTVLGNIVYESVEASRLLALIYDHNPILKIILKI